VKQNQLILIGSLLAFVISAIVVYRTLSVKSNFDQSVTESLKTSEGYDQRFIDMVNRLEDLLATRAKFGYSGGKDPMTGTIRQVVQPQPVPVAPKTSKQPKNAAATAPVAAAGPVDPVKLTAIIGDAAGRKFTAVVMDGERSFSVDPGDVVAGRKISRITNEGIYMESETDQYFYDIYGNIVKKSKGSGESIVPPPEPPPPVVAPKPATNEKKDGGKTKKPK
jgi:hypothetical protein